LFAIKFVDNITFCYYILFFDVKIFTIIYLQKKGLIKKILYTAIITAEQRVRHMTTIFHLSPCYKYMIIYNTCHVINLSN